MVWTLWISQMTFRVALIFDPKKNIPKNACIKEPKWVRAPIPQKIFWKRLLIPTNVNQRSMIYTSNQIIHKIWLTDDETLEKKEKKWSVFFDETFRDFFLWKMVKGKGLDPHTIHFGPLWKIHTIVLSFIYVEHIWTGSDYWILKRKWMKWMEMQKSTYNLCGKNQGLSK